MVRRIQMIVAVAAIAFTAMSEGAWACRCMNRLMNCGGCYSDCCQEWTCSPCEPVGCCDLCGQSAPVPHPPEAKPAVTRDLTPETVPEKKPETKPEIKPPAMTPPAVVAPKDVETPAEPREPAKPATKPEIAPPAIAPPKIAEPAPAGPPALTPPGTAPATKPAAEKKEPAKDDPFGTQNDVKTLRMWTDASGKYRIEARLVSFSDGVVRLQKADGRFVRIEFEFLSTADRDFVLHHDGSLIAAE